MSKKAMKVQIRKEITRRKMRKRNPVDSFTPAIQRLDTSGGLDYETCKNELGWDNDYEHKRF